MEIAEIIAEEAVQALTLEDAPKDVEIVVEIPKSPHTLMLKKDKHLMILMRVSPRNLLHTILMMEEKGNVVNLETDEDEGDLEDLIIEEDEDEGMEEEIEHAHPPTKLLAYIPP